MKRTTYIIFGMLLAGMMFPLAEKAIAEQDFKDVAYFEPFYLKEFVAGTPKKLI